MTSDWALLRQYVENHSEAAFAQITQRHMKLVYWTCRRDIRDAQLAEDATQEVFLALARKAPSLRPDGSLSGWLFITARLTARNMMRKEACRLRHESEAARAMQTTVMDEPGWTQVEPLLNDALSELKPQERDAILLRFLDGLSMGEVAAAIGTSENAACKRVLRAVDRLRRILQKQESALTSATLMALLSTHLAEPAPATCHAAILQAVQSAVAGHTAAGSGFAASFTLLQKGIGIAMQLTTGKIVAAGVATVLIGFLGVGGWVVTHRSATAAGVPGSTTWIDTAIQNPASGSSPDPVRATIDAQYQSIVDGMRRGDLAGFNASLAPGFIASYPGGKQLTRDQLIAAGQQLTAIMKHLDYSGTIASYQRQGDAAVVTLSVHEEMKVSAASQDHDVIVSGVQEDHWQKRNGVWARVSTHVLSDQGTIDGKRETVPGA